MIDHTKHLAGSWSSCSKDAKEKAIEAINELKSKREPVNFSSVHKKSGVSKHFLYELPEVCAMIEDERKQEKTRNALYLEKYDKTSKSKDVILQTKDKYISKLEAENQKLHKELNQLRAIDEMIKAMYVDMKTKCLVRYNLHIFRDHTWFLGYDRIRHKIPFIKNSIKKR